MALTKADHAWIDATYLTATDRIQAIEGQLAAAFERADTNNQIVERRFNRLERTSVRVGHRVFDLETTQHAFVLGLQIFGVFTAVGLLVLLGYALGGGL